MEQAIAYKTYHPAPIHPTASSSSPSHPLPINDVAKVAEARGETASNVQKFLSDNLLVVLGRKGCCMATVVKRLLLGLGVNPAIYEVEGEVEEAEILGEIQRMDGDVKGGDFQFPAVFIRGKLFGGLDRVMATHISGELVPILKEAGALWL